MKTIYNRLSMPAFAGVLAVAAGGSAAMADMFTFTYSDTTGVVASGNLVAVDNGNGTMTCISGDITLSAGPVLGTFPLLPGSGIAPNGAFAYDSLLYTGSPSLDTQGLLFRDAGAALEINIWNDGGGVPYTLYMHTPGAGYFYAAAENGQFSIVPTVPAPASAAALGVGLAAASRRRRV